MPRNDEATHATGANTEELRLLYQRRVVAELAAADALSPGSDVVRSRGALLATVLALKGLPGPAEATGGPAVSGADAEAFEKALAALGWDPGTAFYSLTRAAPDATAEQRRHRVRALVEAIDPIVAIALDAEAAADLGSAFGVSLSPGVEARAHGRRLVALSGFESSLGDEERKRRVWRELKAAAPDGPVF
jgi:hypothetical protein